MKSTIKKGVKVDTKYFITVQYPENWVEKEILPYYALVRTEDEAILYSNEDFNTVIAHCWHFGILRDDVSII